MPRRLVALIAVAWIGGVALAEARAQHGRDHPSTNAVWPRRVEGYGLDQPAAKEHAYQSACREIEAYLQQLQPPIEAWRPTTAYIRTLIVECEEAGPDLPLEPGVAKRWLLHLKAPELDTFYRLDATKQKQVRDEQRRERNGAFARMMIGVLLLVFIVGAGCSRKWSSRPPCHPKAIAC